MYTLSWDPVSSNSVASARERCGGLEPTLLTCKYRLRFTWSSIGQEYITAFIRTQLNAIKYYCFPLVNRGLETKLLEQRRHEVRNQC